MPDTSPAVASTSSSPPTASSPPGSAKHSPPRAAASNESATEQARAAKIVSITRALGGTQNTFDLLLTNEGELRFASLGCVDANPDVYKVITDDCTCVLLSGDIFYEHVPKLQRDGLSPLDEDATNVSRIESDLARPTAPIQVPTFIASGNHDTGNAGHGVTDFETARNKGENLTKGLSTHYRNNLEDRIHLADDQKTRCEKLQFPARYSLLRFIQNGEITYLIQLDSSLLPADQAQQEWLRDVVAPKVAGKRFFIHAHHTPGVTMGERANAKQETKKYPAPSNGDSIGNQHRLFLRTLKTCNINPNECEGIFAAHEHTAAVLDAATLQDANLKTLLPKRMIISGNGGASSNKQGKKAFTVPPPGLDFSQSGYGYFLTSVQKDGTLDVEYYDARTPETPSWRQAYADGNLSQSASSSSSAPSSSAPSASQTKIVSIPEQFKKNELALYLTIVTCLKEGKFDLIKLVLATQMHHKGDTQLSQDALSTFLRIPLPTSAHEAEKVRALLAQIESLMVFFIDPARRVFCTRFFNELCFVHFLLRNVLVELDFHSKKLDQVNPDSYFFPGAIPPSDKPQALSDEVDEAMEAGESALAEETPTKTAPKKPKPKWSGVKDTAIATWVNGVSIEDYRALKAAVLNGIRQYLKLALEYGDPRPAEYFSGLQAHATYASASLFYHLLERTNDAKEGVLLIKRALETADIEFQKLILDTIGLASSKIFTHINVREKKAFQAAFSLAASFEPRQERGESNKAFEERIGWVATRIMLDGFFTLSPEEKSNEGKTYEALFDPALAAQVFPYYIFRPQTLVNDDAMQHFCFQALLSLEESTATNAVKRFLYRVSCGKFFKHQVKAEEQFRSLRAALLRTFVDAEKKNDLLTALQSGGFNHYFNVNLETQNIEAKQEIKNCESTKKLTRLFACFVNSLPKNLQETKDRLYSKNAIAEAYLSRYSNAAPVRETAVAPARQGNSQGTGAFFSSQGSQRRGRGDGSGEHLLAELRQPTSSSRAPRMSHST